MQKFLVASLMVFSACASMKAAMDTSPKMSSIPEGTGWSCYVTNPNTWSSCERTAEECGAAVEAAKSDARFQGATFGPCQPALQASCFTYDVLENQPDGTAKYVPAAECVPDPVTCATYTSGENKIVGASTVSDCVVVK